MHPYINVGASMYELSRMRQSVGTIGSLAEFTRQCFHGRESIMGKKILIVEDEFLVALNLSRTLSSLGYETISIAPDAKTAFQLATAFPDFAFVDVNLRDGETGPTIGKTLAQEFGATVLFLTANPASLGKGVDGTLGCISKPVDEIQVETALEFLVDYQNGKKVTPPPAIRVFANENTHALPDAAQREQR